MRFYKDDNHNNPGEEKMVNTVLTVFVAFVGLLLAGIGLAVLVWFLWWLWKRSEDQKQDLGIEIKAEEAEADATLPVAAAVAAEPDAKVEVQDLEIEAEAPGVGAEARDPEVVVEAPDVEVEADLPEVEAELPEAEIEPPKPDNLQRIEGIGPKLSSVLQAGGITTFAALANADDGQIRQILEDADPRLLRLASLETWREQAALAAAGDWDGLDALQGELKRGRRA